MEMIYSWMVPIGNKRLKRFFRWFCLVVILLLLSMNWFVATQYYFISRDKLSKFFVLQANIKNPADSASVQYGK